MLKRSVFCVLAAAASAPLFAQDAAQMLDQARQLAREQPALVTDTGSGAPGAAGGNAGRQDARAGPIEFQAVQKPAPERLDPGLGGTGGRVGMRADGQNIGGVRPYAAMDVDTVRPIGSVPAPGAGAPALELGASAAAGRDTNVSAGVRQTQPTPGAPGEPPIPARSFQFGIGTKF